MGGDSLLRVPSCGIKFNNMEAKMAKKYRALVDIPPNVKAGDIVSLKEDPIPEFKNKLQRVTAESAADDEDDEDGEKSAIMNPDRNALKARATELNINFASNIPTERLMELVEEAEEKAAAEAADADKSGTE